MRDSCLWGSIVSKPYKLMKSIIFPASSLSACCWWLLTTIPFIFSLWFFLCDYLNRFTKSRHQERENHINHMQNVYVGCNNPTIDLILKKTICWVAFGIFRSYSHLYVKEHSLIMSHETHAHPHIIRPIFSLDLTWNRKSSENTTVEHVATVSPFEFLFSNFQKTSIRYCFRLTLHAYRWLHASSVLRRQAV